MTPAQPSIASRDAFISYSSRDSEFVTALRIAFETNGRHVWQDVKELELTEEWWTQIKSGIATADNYIFVVSPRSLASPVCHLEFEYARLLHKRVILVRYEIADEVTSTEAMFERLRTQEYLQVIAAGRDMAEVADANWRVVDAEQNITITSKEEIADKVLRIIEAFDKDLLYIRQSNILLGRAREWDDSERNPSFLLSGSALSAAELWRDAGKNPPPTQDHIDYITASRRAEDQRRRSTILLALMGIFALVAIIGLVLAARQLTIEADTAVNQAATATVAQGAAIIEQNRAVAEAEIASTREGIALEAQGTAQAEQSAARTAQQTAEAAADEARGAAATAQSEQREAIAAQETAIALALEARFAEADSQLALGELLYQRLLAGSDITPAEDALRRALVIYEEFDDQAGQAQTWLTLGDIAMNRRGDPDAADEAYQKALDAFRATGNQQQEAYILRRMGEGALNLGNHEVARETLQAALPIFREIDDSLGEAETLLNLGTLAIQQVDYETAHERLNAALVLFEDISDLPGQANTQRNLGELAMQEDDLATARAAYDSALSLFRQLDDRLGEANTLYNLGMLALFEEDAEAAREWFEVALLQFEEIGEPLGEANTLVGLAEMSMLTGEFDAAANYHARAESLYRQSRILFGEINVLISRSSLFAQQDDIENACATIDDLLALVEGTDYENNPVVDLQRENYALYCSDSP